MGSEKLILPIIIISTYFPNRNIHKETQQSHVGRTNNQIDHVLVYGRHAFSMMDVRSCGGADRDVYHHLARIKYGQIIMKYKNTHATGLNKV